MGTRNVTMVISNGETKVAQYGQWDGYPGGQGATALRILTQIANEGGFDTLKNRVNKLTWLTEAQSKEIDALPGDTWVEKYPYLSRDWGAEILDAVMYGKLHKEAGYSSAAKTYTFDIIGLVNSEKFAADSLFCEWAYVIDLDKMTFEVYEGFNKEPLTEGERFQSLEATLIAERAEKGRETEYYPVKHLKTYDLNNLPTLQEFLAELEPKEEEDEVEVDD